MKLVELLGVKKYQDKKMNELAYEVQKSGIWKQLGSGTFAQVLERQGKVYKFWIVDDAYETFLKFVNLHPNNKHLPKVGPIKTLMIGSKKLKYVEIEKLNHCDAYNTKIRMNSGKTDSGHSHVEKIKAEKNEMRTTTFLSMIDRKIGHEFASFEQIKAYLMRDHGYILDDEDTIDIIKLFIDLAKYVPGSKFEFDLGEDNVMMRGDTLVITDPLYHHGVPREK